MSSSSTTNRRATRGSSGWFVWNVGLWVAFFVLLHNQHLGDVATWIQDLPLPLERLMWVVFFPWVLATAVWTSGWSEDLRLTLVILSAIVWTLVSIPRR